MKLIDELADAQVCYIRETLQDSIAVVTRWYRVR